MSLSAQVFLKPRSTSLARRNDRVIQTVERSSEGVHCCWMCPNLMHCALYQICRMVPMTGSTALSLQPFHIASSRGMPSCAKATDPALRHALAIRARRTRDKHPVSDDHRNPVDLLQRWSARHVCIVTKSVRACQTLIQVKTASGVRVEWNARNLHRCNKTRFQCFHCRSFKKSEDRKEQRSERAGETGEWWRKVGVLVENLGNSGGEGRGHDHDQRRDERAQQENFGGRGQGAA